MEKRTSQFLTTAEAAEAMHVHINTVRRWNNQGLVKAVRVGPRGDRRFSRGELDNSISAELTTAEAAEAMHVHINTVRRWNNQGLVKAVRVGPRGDRRFNRGELDKFMQNDSHYSS